MFYRLEKLLGGRQLLGAPTGALGHTFTSVKVRTYLPHPVNTESEQIEEIRVLAFQMPESVSQDNLAEGRVRRIKLSDLVRLPHATKGHA